MEFAGRYSSINALANWGFVELSSRHCVPAGREACQTQHHSQSYSRRQKNSRLSWLLRISTLEARLGVAVDMSCNMPYGCA